MSVCISKKALDILSMIKDLTNADKICVRQVEVAYAEKYRVSIHNYKVSSIDTAVEITNRLQEYVNQLPSNIEITFIEPESNFRLLTNQLIITFFLEISKGGENE